jgi:hypothetical protein
MSEQAGSKAGSVSKSESRVQKQEVKVEHKAIADRIAALKTTDPVAYKKLEVKEVYSLNEAVAISGMSRAWIYRQVKKLQRFPGQTRLVEIKDEEGNTRQAWRLNISVVEKLYATKQESISSAQKVIADPKAHYKPNRETLSLTEQVKKATPEELAELRKLLGL